MTRKVITYLVFSLIVFSFLLSIHSCCADLQTEIIMTPSTDHILKGESFTLTISITPSEPIGGWQLDLRFDQTRVQPVTITPGTSWAAYFDPGIINNTTGTIRGMQTWTTDSFPTTPHTMCAITFIALEAGLCAFSIEHIQVTNASFTDILVVTHNVTISISEGGTGHEPGEGGYLVDENGDGTYDTYHDNESGNNTTVQKQHTGRYLIDQNGDGVFDTDYDPQTNIYSSYHPPQDNSLLIIGGILAAIFVLIVLLYVFPRKKVTKK